MEGRNMAMLITTIAKIKESCTEEGFKMFCSEQGFDPGNYQEPEEGVCVDKFDLYRYGAAAAAQSLSSSVNALKAEIGM
jgi:hypothetical protein